MNSLVCLAMVIDQRRTQGGGGGGGTRVPASAPIRNRGLPREPNTDLGDQFQSKKKAILRLKNSPRRTMGLT